MDVSFTATPTFNEKANFNQIVFGEGAPLLEVELNEMQAIISDQFKRLGEGLFKRDGFVSLTTDFKTNGLLTVSGLAFLDGVFVRVSNISITLTSGSAVYLAYKTATITGTSTVKEYGNLLSSTSIKNNIIDSRLGEETTKRKQMTYTLLKTNTDTSYSYVKLGTVTSLSSVLTFKPDGNVKVSTVSEDELAFLNYLSTNIYIEGNQVVDSRTINGGEPRSPRQYRDLALGKANKGLIVSEFQTKVKAGIPNATSGFVIISTYSGWTDTSGGGLVQVAFSTSEGKMYVRGTSGETKADISTEEWGAWTQNATLADINTHENRKDNPHGVTSAQVNILADNFANNASLITPYPIGISTFRITSDMGYPSTFGMVTTHKSSTYAYQYFATISGTTNYTRNYDPNKSTWSAWTTVETTTGAQSRVDTHANKKDNPHGVTKSQVGLGNVENYGIATTNEAKAGTVDNKYMTPLKTNEAIEALIPSTLTTDLASKLTRKIVTTSADLNTFTTSGLYTLKFNSAPNQPTTVSGDLYVNADVGTPYQLYIPSGANNELYKRAFNVTTGEFTTAWNTIKGTDTIYTHPTTDGNLHVPATGTTNSGKVLKSGETAGSISWGTLAKGDVGLGSVNNYGIATTAEAQAGTSDAKYMTPVKTSDAISKLAIPRVSTATKTAFDWDTYTTPGIYSIALEKLTDCTNYPTLATYGYGNLIVLKSGNDIYSVTQVYIPHSQNGFYIRTGYENTRWTTWERLATIAEVDKAVKKTGDTMTGTLTAPTIKTGNFEISSNTTLNTLDFVYNG